MGEFNTEVSKVMRVSRAVCLCALLGMIFSVCLGLCLNVCPRNLEEENTNHFKDKFGQSYNIVARRIHDGFITLTIKFLHFSIAKSLQFIYLWPLKPVPSTTSSSMLFWVSLTRSVSSMYS